MRNISHFINVLFFVLFFSNLLFTQGEKIKNIQIFGSNINTTKSIFFKDEIINVSFDELSHKTNSYYYTVDHCDYGWNKSNIFKNEVIQGYDDLRISDYKKSFNTLEKFTNYSFSFPNENFKINLSGNFLLTVRDLSQNIIFQRKLIIIEKTNPGSIDVFRAKEFDKRNSYQNLKIRFRCIDCIFDNSSQYKLVVIQNNNLNNYLLVNKTTLKTSKEMIYDNVLFEAGDEYLSFDTKNIIGTNNEINKVIANDIYSTILFKDVESSSYTYRPDKNGVFITNSLSQDNILESDYTRVNFFLETQSHQNDDIYIVGDFNEHKINEMYKLKKTENNLYKCDFKLKQGYYNYKYVVIKNGVIKNLSNFWQTENNYSAFLYRKKASDRYYKIVGYSKKNSEKIVN